MEPIDIIKKYYKENSDAYRYLVLHSEAVTHTALKVVRQNPRLKADEDTIRFSGMLHDIGIIKTKAPKIGCFGKHPYIAHGYLGREMLEQEGLLRIAPVCERHIGTGLTSEDIIREKLQIPVREMVPITIEEKIVCYADKFFSKSSEDLAKPKPVEKIRKNLSKYGEEKVKIFDDFVRMFGLDYIYEE